MKLTNSSPLLNLSTSSLATYMQVAPEIHSPTKAKKMVRSNYLVDVIVLIISTGMNLALEVDLLHVRFHAGSDVNSR